MIKSIIFIFLLSLNVWADSRDINTCPPPHGDDPFALVNEAFEAAERQACLDSVEGNIYSFYQDENRDRFCSEYGLRSHENRACHQTYQWTPAVNANDISFRCLASVYNGTIEVDPQGVIRGRFSNTARRSNHFDKVAQLQEAFSVMVDDQIAIGTDINQYANFTLIRDGISCSADQFNEIMQCENAEASQRLSEIIGQLRRQNRNEHMLDNFKNRYVEAIISVDGSQTDLNANLFSIRELQEHLGAAHTGYSAGRRYYLDDNELFSNAGNLRSMNFHRNFDSVEQLREVITREMDLNFNQTPESERVAPASYEINRERFIAQQERRFTMGNVLLRATRYLLNEYQNIDVNFAPGQKYDMVINHVDSSLLSHLGDSVSPEELERTGWFKRDGDNLRFDRSIAFGLIDIAKGDAEDGSINPDLIPDSLDDLAGIWTALGTSQYRQLQQRCDSFIEAKNNLCNAIENNQMLMNDRAAGQCLRDNQEDLSPQEMVALGHQYCSGQGDYLFGGEPAPREPERFSPDAPGIQRTSVTGSGAYIDEQRDIAQATDDEIHALSAEIEQTVDPERERELRERIARLRSQRDIARSNIRRCTGGTRDPAQIELLNRYRRQLASASGFEHGMVELHADISRIERELCLTPGETPTFTTSTVVDPNGIFTPDNNPYEPDESVSQKSLGNIDHRTAVQNHAVNITQADGAVTQDFAKQDGVIEGSMNTGTQGNFAMPAMDEAKNPMNTMNLPLNDQIQADSGGTNGTIPSPSPNTNPGNSDRIRLLQERIDALTQQMTPSNSEQSSRRELEELELQRQLAELERERLELEREELDGDTEAATPEVATTPNININGTSGGNTFTRSPASQVARQVTPQELNPEQTPLNAQGIPSPITRSASGLQTNDSDRPATSYQGVGQRGVIQSGLSLTTNYGRIQLDTGDVQSLLTEPPFVESPEQLNLDQLAIGDEVYLRLADGSFVLHRKLEDGTIFRQQAMVGGAEVRSPAAEGPAPVRTTPVIRLDQIEREVDQAP